MIHFTHVVSNLSTENLQGFFVGWPNPPSPQTHLELLNNSDAVILAIDEETGNVVGFVTAISDGILSAYIPLLEVLPDYQHQGIGKTLMTMMLDKLQHLYMVDILCDAELQPFYKQLGMIPAIGMMKRNYRNQAGTSNCGITSNCTNSQLSVVAPDLPKSVG
jgi:GNAT superfamily N-acetyltransferase